MGNAIKILVVDDFITMRSIVRSFLSDLGYTNIEEADDGVTAMPILQSMDVELLITDWGMPGMSGLELLRYVRSDARLADLPVLMISSEAREEQVALASEAGVNGYLVKPFDINSLRIHLDKVFADVAVA